MRFRSVILLNDLQARMMKNVSCCDTSESSTVNNARHLASDGKRIMIFECNIRSILPLDISCVK